MMIWTIVDGNGVEQTATAWGVSQLKRTLRSQAADELTFTVEGSTDTAPLFAAYSTITLWRNRTLNPDGTFSGGTLWFQGLVTTIPRSGAPDAESMGYTVTGPWWYLDNRVFQQAYQNIFLGYAVAGDPTTAIYGVATSSHLFLNQADVPNALAKITTGQQINEAVNWVLQPFVLADVPPPLQLGTVTPVVDCPIDEVKDITCAEVIHKMLRWSPDAVTFFDYTQNPPAIKCLRRLDMSVVTLDVSTGNLVRDLRINARYDLLAPSVQIYYETKSTINGQESLSLTKDYAPDPLPTAPFDQFAALQMTVDLQGISATSSSVTLVCDGLNPGSPDWWLSKHPQYQLLDPTNIATFANDTISFDIVASSLTRKPNPPIGSNGLPAVDKGFTNELTSGQLTSWLKSNNGYDAQRITYTVNAKILKKNGTKPINTTLTYQCVSTNAASGTYTNNQVSAYPEPVPVGLAAAIYDSIKVLQFDGSLTLQEQDVSGQVLIGQMLNITGSANAEWATMNALVQEISENIDTGTTTVRLGTIKPLGAGDLINLLRMQRLRNIRNGYSMRAAGAPSGGDSDLELGSNTPEKNSSSAVPVNQTFVISPSPDGTGSTIIHDASLGGDCKSLWSNIPPDANTPPAPGSILIQLSQALGHDIALRQYQVCTYNSDGSVAGIKNVIMLGSLPF